MPAPAPLRLRPAKLLLFVGVTSLGLLGLSVALDRALGLLGYPDAVPIAPPPHYEKWVENTDFRYLLRTNSMGLRYREIPLQKPDGTFRFVVLGDSATAGEGVVEADRWTDRIEALFREQGRDVEMINCAESGTGPLNYGQKLFHLCIDYQPNAVLIALHINDVDGTREDEDPGEMFPGTRARRGTLLRNVAYRLWPHVYTQLRSTLKYGTRFKHTDLIASIRSETTRLGIPDERYSSWREMVTDEQLDAMESGRINGTILVYPLTKPDFYRTSLDLETDAAGRKFDAMTRLLGVIQRRCAELGIPVGIMLLPSLYQYDRNSGDRPQARLYAAMGAPMRQEWTTGPTRLEQRLDAWSREAGIPFLNLAPAFRRAASSGEPLNFPFDIHWNAAGNALAAGEIHAWLEEGSGRALLQRP